VAKEESEITSFSCGVERESRIIDRLPSTLSEGIRHQPEAVQAPTEQTAGSVFRGIGRAHVRPSSAMRFRRMHRRIT